MAEPLLAVSRLCKSFGGLAANQDIDLAIHAGEVHAVIGPNGAGKTTLVAQLSGELKPSSGSVLFDGMEISGLPAHRRASLGLARTFQITSIWKDFTALENVALAAQAQAGHSFRFWAPASANEALNRRALVALQAVGLDARRDAMSMELSHGEHRQLEIAMAVVTAPKLMLLDEPTAGMGPEESQTVVSLLRSLKRRHAMLLIEHDMDVVFAIADRITVLVGGRVIASGAPAEIKASREVQDAYLGDGGLR
ncbi:MAG: ABC transporter ATP-binding protein [Betaproteobacteria bacterium]|nr:ABC transporter ATP-binding protein [Betaproteobacteria bacterium]